MESAKRSDRNSSKTPTRWGSFVFVCKVLGLRAKRWWDDRSSTVRRWPIQQSNHDAWTIRRELRSQLWTSVEESERRFELGKVQNLRVACSQLHGIVLEPGTTFSFWRQIGRASRGRGFVVGRMLQQGCVIPAIGGGLCQLSNMLYGLALMSHCEILERHAHSVKMPNAPIHDATVAWNYIDLRFRVKQRTKIVAAMSADELILEFQYDQPISTALRTTEETTSPGLAPAESCETCNETNCFRHIGKSGVQPIRETTAYIVDVYWPEFGQYVDRAKQSCDVLMLPVDGKRWKRPQYGWTTTGFARVHTAAPQTLWRAWHSRRLSAQGAERQKHLQRSAMNLAAAFADRLTPEVTRLYVSQNLLPWLWRMGAMRGRRFEVLMNSPSMQMVQETLDQCARLHPESVTAMDFRADRQLVTDELEALHAAERLITPNLWVAETMGANAYIVPRIALGKIKMKHQVSGRPRIYFPSGVLARRGAFELREALQGLDVELIVRGRSFEGNDFWKGIQLAGVGAIDEGVSAVVLPAFLLEQPRVLLDALAAGIPVIATINCGLPVMDGLTLVPVGDAAALRDAIQTRIGTQEETAWAQEETTIEA